MCRETEGDRVQHMAHEDAKEASNVAAAGRHILAAQPGLLHSQCLLLITWAVSTLNLHMSHVHLRRHQYFI